MGAIGSQCSRRHMSPQRSRHCAQGRGAASSATHVPLQRASRTELAPGLEGVRDSTCSPAQFPVLEAPWAARRPHSVSRGRVTCERLLRAEAAGPRPLCGGPPGFLGRPGNVGQRREAGPGPPDPARGRAPPGRGETLSRKIPRPRDALSPQERRGSHTPWSRSPFPATEVTR